MHIPSREPRYLHTFHDAISNSRPRAAGTPSYIRHFDRLVAPRQAAMFAVLRKGVEDGEIRADVDLQWVNDLLVAPVMVAVLTHRPHLSRAQLEFTIDTILRGIAP
jgi:hypothetical protein